MADFIEIAIGTKIGAKGIMNVKRQGHF